jgi:hypothetical protein
MAEQVLPAGNRTNILAPNKRVEATFCVGASRRLRLLLARAVSRARYSFQDVAGHCGFVDTVVDA